MAAITFFGNFFLGLGPGLVFFCFFLANKSFLVLLSLFSAFVWLSVLLVISGIFRGFYPIPEAQGSYAGVLIASVFIQEGARYGVWRMHKKSVEVLEGMSRSTGHRFSLLDKLYMALAWGYGHAACHAVFFFLSLLPLTTGDGTFYLDTCPQMSLFLVGALYSLSFGMILTSITMVAMDGHHSNNKLHIAFAPVMHLGASMLTLGNYNDNGCMWVMPILLALGVANTWYAISICWRKGVQPRPTLVQS